MQKFRRIVFIVASIILVILLLAGIVVYHIGHQALPDYNESVQLEGFSHSVSVYRDSAGVPHVYADNARDLYRATGYLMAQDRLWQMDLFRRVTQGRLTEIFGKRMLEDDMIMRSLKIPAKSRKVYKRSDERVREALRAFAAGVNVYLEHHRQELPPEFTLLGYQPERWKPIHSINLIGYMAWDLAPAWEAEVVMNKIAAVVPGEKYRQMVPKTDRQDASVYTPPKESSAASPSLSLLLDHSRRLEQMGLKIFSGSNNWAVSGKKSETGKPLFANDMHLGLFAPGIWYQIHQVVEGQVNVTGVALPGQPLVISGHNDSIAWGMTNVMVDDMDFYRETLRPGDSAQYRLNGEWKDMKVEQERFILKDGDTLTRRLYYTHRGPVISRFKDITDRTLSMRWVGNAYSNELRSVYRLNRASNWADFKDAVRSFRSISQNIAYADVQGNIGMYCCAGVPIRQGNASTIFPGDTTRYDWQGFVPFDELPHQYNPEKGMVSSANNRTVHPDYPHYISHWFDLSPRIDRIRQMLQQQERLSVQDFMDIQTDHRSRMVDLFRDKMLQVVRDSGELSPEQQQAVGLLARWDRVYRKESAAAAIFEQFYVTFLRNLIRDELGGGLYKEYLGSKILVRNLMKNVWKQEASPWCDDVNTPEKEDFEAIIEQSFNQTLARLTEQMGQDPDSWEWGRIHQLELKHPIGGEVPVLDLLFDMNRGPFQVGGSFHTVCPYSYSFDEPFTVNHGASHRHVYSTADWNQSRTIIPTGTSGIPASDHYCDQTRRYIQKTYRRDLFEREKIETHARYQMNIEAP